MVPPIVPLVACPLINSSAPLILSVRGGRCTVKADEATPNCRILLAGEIRNGDVLGKEVKDPTANVPGIWTDCVPPAAERMIGSEGVERVRPPFEGKYMSDDVADPTTRFRRALDAAYRK